MQAPFYRAATTYEPAQKHQGFYIDQMKDHALIKISRDEAATMRCASFKGFDYVCKYITRTEGIRKDRVYPALRMIGYNQCYHNMKINLGDVFTNIIKLIKSSEAILDYDVMMRTDVKRTFINTDTYTKVYKVNDQVKAIALETADNAEIRTSDLNLYHAMHGLKVLVENEPDFISKKDNEIIQDVLKILNRSDRSLLQYQRDLEILKG